MKKNILYFILFTFLLLSGCTSSYNVTISDNKITEDINLNIENDYQDIDGITGYDYAPITRDSEELYEKKVTKKDGYTNINLKYSFDPEVFPNSTALSTCFENYEVIIDDNYYEFKLSGYLNCLADGEVDINVKTKNKVISHNADSVDGNVYTWHIDQDNVDDTSIEIKISRDKTSSSRLVDVLLIAIVLFVVFVVVKIFKKKNRERNKF